MATKETRVFISGNNAGWRRSRDSATRQDSHHSPKNSHGTAHRQPEEVHGRFHGTRSCGSGHRGVRCRHFHEMPGDSRAFRFGWFSRGWSHPTGNRCRQSVPGSVRSEFIPRQNTVSAMWQSLEKRSMCSMPLRSEPEKPRNTMWRLPENAIRRS
jgi:hypothetical protein